jgi:hypothetical protein
VHDLDVREALVDDAEDVAAMRPKPLMETRMPMGV